MVDEESKISFSVKSLIASASAVIGFIVMLAVNFYDRGERACRETKEAALLKCNNDCYEKMRPVQNELNTCSKELGRVESLWGLSKHEVQELLTSLRPKEAKLDLTYAGKELEGNHLIDVRHISKSNECAGIPIWITNNGEKAIKPALIRVKAPFPYGYLHGGAIHSGGDSTEPELFGFDLNIRSKTLPPGASDSPTRTRRSWTS